MNFNDFCPKHWHQSAPNRPKDDPKKAAFFIFDFCFDFGPFLTPFWLPLGTLLERFSQICPGALQKA